MAIVDKKGGLHGKMAQVVYRQVGDLQVVQSRPKKFKQTLATRESGIEFGLASNTARIIRNVMMSSCHSADRGMANRLTSTITKCIRGSKEKIRGERDIHDGDLSFLRGFQFNRNSPLNQVLEVRPEVRRTEDGKVTIRIPAFDPYKQLHDAPNGISYFTLRLIATAFHFRSEYSEHLDYHDIEFTHGTCLEEQIWTIDKELPAGCVVLFTASLFALRRTKLGTMTFNSKEWSPAEIVGATQVPQGNHELLAPDYISGNGGWRMSGQPAYQRTGSPFDKCPLTAYLGKELFGKIEVRRNKASRQDLDKLMRARAELQARSRSEQVSNPELKSADHTAPALPPVETGRKSF